MHVYGFDFQVASAFAASLLVYRCVQGPFAACVLLQDCVGAVQQWLLH
jgi:hypothetical protein